LEIILGVDAVISIVCFFFFFYHTTPARFCILRSVVSLRLQQSLCVREEEEEEEEEEAEGKAE
jgi:hypothetical protein